MSYTLTPFNCFVDDVHDGKHDLSADTLKLLLTDTAPNVADTVVDTTGGVCVVKSTSNANEIAAGNGYTKGGETVGIASSTQTAGVYKLVASATVPFTASGVGNIGPFRYGVLYNVSKGAAATRPVIAKIDFGAEFTLSGPDGNILTVSFDAANGIMQDHP